MDPYRAYSLANFCEIGPRGSAPMLVKYNLLVTVYLSCPVLWSPTAKTGEQNFKTQKVGAKNGLSDFHSN